MSRIEITPTLSIDDSQLEWRFIAAAGPGGQNVNKTASAVQLQFDVGRAALPDAVQSRLMKLAGKRITGDGRLIIVARRFRAQEQNRQDALARLLRLIRRATEAPPRRRKTRPTAASKERRLQAKRRRSDKKRTRGSVGPSDE